MSIITQDNRLLKIDTALEPNSLILTKLSGSEQLSSNFIYNLTGFSQINPINCETLLGSPATITIKHDDHPVIINGIIWQITAKGMINQSFREYEIQMVPHFANFTLTSHQQIFQNLSVIEIFTTICKGNHFFNFNLSQLENDYPKLPYVVQYRESDYDFLRRILAEAGIFFYFVHSQDNHTLILADHHQSLPTMDIHYRYTHFQLWQSKADFQISKYIGKGYHPTHANQPLYMHYGNKHSTNLAANNLLLNYHFVHRCDRQSLASIVQREMAIDNWQANAIFGKSNIMRLCLGNLVNIEGSTYFPIAIRHFAVDHSHLVQEHGQQVARDYKNEFSCISSKLPYYQLQQQSNPFTGLHFAKVIGQGKAVSTHHYAEVRVKFPWQENDEDFKNTYWLRTTQMLAGMFGSQFLPRNGNKVLVAFNDHQGSSPVVIGNCYGEQLPPFSTDMHISGIKTLSINNQGTHEVSFDDQANAEKFNIKAHNHLHIDINHHEVKCISHDYSVMIDGNQNIEITKGRWTLNSPQKIKIAAGQSHITLTPNYIKIQAPMISLG